MKGMAYTAFALLVTSMMVLLVMVPITTEFQDFSGDPTRIGEASFFLDSVMRDTDRSLSIASRRAVTGAGNFVMETGKPLQSPEENLSEALVKGEISGRELSSMGNASLENWEGRVQEIGADNGYRLNVTLDNYSFEASGMRLNASYDLFARLKDPVTLVSINESREVNKSISAEGVPDALLLIQSQSQYVSQYRACDFKEPAEKLEEGPIHSEAGIHGEAEKNPHNLAHVDNKSEKILVVERINTYSTSQAEDFKGIVSAQPNNTDYSTEYVFDTGSISSIEDNQSLTVYDGGVWRTNFREMFKQNCYVPDGNAPDILDRFENDLSGTGGISTMVNVPELPSALQQEASSVGYLYFQDVDGDRVRGVTNEYRWFRLDDQHANQWNVDSLTY